MFKTLLLVGASATALVASSVEAAVTTFNYTGGAQSYAAAAGIYDVHVTGASGAAGGYSTGGVGAMLGAHVTLNTSATLNIIVGGAGGNPVAGQTSFAGGGGGGTFVLGGSTPVMIAGGGGGGGQDSFRKGGGVSNGKSATLSALGTDGGAVAGSGAGGSFGSAGAGGNQHYTGRVEDGNGGGGAGLLGAGGNGTGSRSGGGGGSIPSFSGGAGAQTPGFGWFAGSGGFGGGGGGGAGGGGGGGFSGGGGGSGGALFSGGGGGGGSFIKAGATDLVTGPGAAGNGVASIEALRYFADAKVPDTLAFGVVRSYVPATKSLTVGNGVVASAISDRLVTTLGTASSTEISSTAAPTELLAGKTGTINYTLNAQSGPGIFVGSVTLGFKSHPATGTDVALGSKTIAVTATVTDAAVGEVLSTGAGHLAWDDTTGNYVLDMGDVAAGSTVKSQLSLLNSVTASAYSETLTGQFAGPFDSDGFSYAGGYFQGIVGGTQASVGAVSFDSTGQSLGLHSQYFEFQLSSHFSGIADYDLGLFRIDMKTNVVEPPPPVAGVPEPATWGLMLGGFGMIGAAMRRRKRQFA